ncbi:MAG: hypothetical protein JXR22_08085, partial [Prolixibacteraceae bacterium]|nr:hypothetical protein [Prolixibacteraceae bacterium]
IYLYAFAILIRIAKMKIQIRLIEKHLQPIKFQTFQRTFLDFNGTVMVFFLNQFQSFDTLEKLLHGK